jgi:hypothetical protein
LYSLYHKNTLSSIPFKKAKTEDFQGEKAKNGAECNAHFRGRLQQVFGELSV